MKVKVNMGRGPEPETSPTGKKSPAQRQRKQPQAAMAAMAGPPQGYGGVDPAAAAYAMSPFMAGMYPNLGMSPYMASPYMPSPYMGVPGMYPMAGMPQMYGGVPGGMPPGGVTPASPKAAGGAAKPGRTKSRGRRRVKTKGGRDRGSSPGPSAEATTEEHDPNRSAALTEVRNKGTKCKLTLKEVLPDILEFAQDQHGSRYLQSKLDDATPEEKQAVFDTILPQAPSLASDAFGNWVVQKFFDFDIGTLDQRKALVNELLPKLLSLSNETHGCRVVQKAIQHVPRESQLAIAGKLKENVIGCIESMHGNHVMQKCIEQMPPDSVTFIIKAVENEAEKMASHMYGCRVVQRLLEHCASHQLQKMLDLILDAIPRLAQDPYGNYVVQHMLEHGRKDDKRRIIGVVQANIVEFSKHKCSSNVVEKALEIATIGEHAQVLEEDRTQLMRKVIGEPGDPNPPLRQMMDDRFGNFIVQRMVEHARGPERDQLRQHLIAAEQQLKSSSHGRHILAALQKEFS